MVTQKQIKAWIPEALAIFQRFMPPFPGMDTIPIPEIHIVSDKTVFPTRKMLVAKLRSRQTDIDEDHYTSIMEMIHGDLGDAILIWQKYIPDPQKILLRMIISATISGMNWVTIMPSTMNVVLTTCTASIIRVLQQNGQSRKATGCGQNSLQRLSRYM